MRRLARLPLAAALLLALGALALTAFSPSLRAASGHTRKRTAGGQPAGCGAQLFVPPGAAQHAAGRGAGLRADVRGDPVAPAQGSRRPGAWSAWDALAAAPLFLPASATALLWRPFSTTIDLANRRIWPWRSLLSYSPGFVAAQFPGRAYGGARNARAQPPSLRVSPHSGLTLLDAGTLLLLTGGQPFNATHVWASWAFHTVWVSRLWGHGAVMLGGLAAAGVLIAGCSIIWSRTRLAESRRLRRPLLRLAPTLARLWPSPR